MPFYFPTIGQYAGLLERSGFKVLHMSLFDRMTPLKGSNVLADWIKMFIKKLLKIYPKKKKTSLSNKRYPKLASGYTPPAV